VPPAPPELEVLYRIGVAVHRVVRDAQSSPHRADVVAMGADGTPTEELDRLAEAEILRALDREGVDWDLLSEEIGHVRRGGDRTLVVDPIDGSHNALRQQPTFRSPSPWGRAPSPASRSGWYATSGSAPRGGRVAAAARSATAGRSTPARGMRAPRW